MYQCLVKEQNEQKMGLIYKSSRHALGDSVLLARDYLLKLPQVS